MPFGPVHIRTSRLILGTSTKRPYTRDLPEAYQAILLDEPLVFILYF
jgi:hypothetical protein